MIVTSRYLNSKYSKLEAYVPGEQPRDKKYIKLNTNESPYPPSKEVVSAITAEEVQDLRLYSDPECKNLKIKLAKRYNLPPQNIYLSNGSDDILNFAFMAFCDAKAGAAFPEITYGFYKVFAELYGIDAKIIPLKDDFSIDYRDYLGLNRMIVIANPNAPTGRMLAVHEIEQILKTNPDHVVVIDEAYVDFGGESVLPLLASYENLLIVRTFSKSRALAGARLGFAFGSKEIISDLEKIRYSTNPYNVNRLTLLAGAAAIDSDSYFMENCQRIMATREKVTKELCELGFDVVPSKANFIFARSAQIGGEELYQKLKERGILVRHFSSEKIKDYNRITIGSEEEMDTFVDTIKLILSEENEKNRRSENS